MRPGSLLDVREAIEREPEPTRKFQLFRQAFSRTYSGSEAKARFRRFSENLRQIERLNKRNGARAFGVSSFADLFPNELPRTGFRITRSPESYQADVVGGRLRDIGLEPHIAAREQGAEEPVDTRRLPEAFNWGLTRIITPVKNQGTCGACWAFVAAEEVESMYNLWGSGVFSEFGVEQTFSVQQLLSCAPAPALGCGGGNPLDAYDYLVDESAGLVQESLWPYEQGVTPEDNCEAANCTSPCRKRLLEENLRKITGPPGMVTSYRWATPPCRAGTQADGSPACANQDLEQLQRSLVLYGPVAIAVNGEHWGLYNDGVLTYEGCGSSSLYDMNHAAQLVGYDRRAPEPYWLVRNQWGTAWGASQPESGIPTGYIKLEFGKNTCGLANWATIPVVPGFDEQGIAGKTAAGGPIAATNASGSNASAPHRADDFPGSEYPGDLSDEDGLAGRNVSRWTNASGAGDGGPGAGGDVPPASGGNESAAAGSQPARLLQAAAVAVRGRRSHRPERFRLHYAQAAGEPWEATLASLLAAS